MARLNLSWQSHRPRQWNFCLVLVINVLVLSTITFVTSASIDHSDIETNVLNTTPNDTTQFSKVYKSLASLFKGAANSAVESTKHTALLNKRKRRSGDSEAFPFEASETCSLTETELDQIIDLIQKFGAVDKDFCKKLPAGASKTVASRQKSTSSTKSVSNPIKSANNWSKLANNVRSKSTVNSTQLATSPTKSGIKSTAIVVSPTKSLTNSTKLATTPKKSTATSVSQTKSGTNTTKPIVSPTKSAVNSTKLTVSSKNSDNNSTASLLVVRRKRSLPAGGCNQLIESIKLSTNKVKSAFCDLSSIQGGAADPLYEERKVAYESEINQLKEQLDNKDLQVEQKYKAKIDKLKTDFQKVEKNMRDTLIKLETEQFSHMKTNAELVLSLMKMGEIQKALDKFKILELRNNTMRIVSIALIKENVPIENVIKFTEGLREIDTMLYGTLHLFFELEKKQSLYDPVIVSKLQNAIEKVIQRLVEMEGKSVSSSSKKIDRYAIEYLIRVQNKLDFLKISAFKQN